MTGFPRLCHHGKMPTKKKTTKKPIKKNPTDPIKLAYEVIEAAIGEPLTQNGEGKTTTREKPKRQEKAK